MYTYILIYIYIHIYIYTYTFTYIYIIHYIILTSISSIHLPKLVQGLPVLRHWQGPNTWHLRRSRYISPEKITVESPTRSGMDFHQESTSEVISYPSWTQIALSLQPLSCHRFFQLRLLRSVPLLFRLSHSPAQGPGTTESICPSGKGHRLCETRTVPVVFIHDMEVITTCSHLRAI